MYKFLLLEFLFATPVLAQDQAAVLRAEAGCGPPKTKFDVKVDKKQNTLSHIRKQVRRWCTQLRNINRTLILKLSGM